MTVSPPLAPPENTTASSPHQPASEDPTLSELLDKLDLGNDKAGSTDIANEPHSVARQILGVLFSPIILILAAWVAIFVVYGRQIISYSAPFAR
jgi:hypothetical protein